LYTLDGAFTTANLTLVGEADFTLADGTDLEVVNVPVTGSFGAGDVLVVEWHTESGEATLTRYYPGANSAGEPGPSYIASASCGLSEPTTYAAIDFPDVHLVMNVHGTGSETGDPLMLTVSPEGGSIAPGGSEDLTLTAEAGGAAEGEYPFELLITSNDPVNPTLTVDVTVTVGEG